MKGISAEMIKKSLQKIHIESVKAIFMEMLV